jgi:multicomponent Na+:H+ antiporter subunit D
MSQHLPALIVAIPLLTAFLVFAVGWFRRELCFPLGLCGLGLTALSCAGLLVRVLQGGTVTYRLGGWPAPWGIVYVVDTLNGLVLAAVSLAALIQWVGSGPSVSREFPDRLGALYGLQMLFVTGLLGITVTGDAFNLYVLLEIASITAYALIAMGGGRAPLSSLNYVFMGTVGACFYLLGVGYLYIMTGTLNMADLARLLTGLQDSGAVQVAFVIIMVGLWLKMAFFPLHGWLPNAYTHAPSAVTSLIAPLMTKVMAYVMIRMVLHVFGPAYSFETLRLHGAVVWLGVVAVVMGSILALAQRNLKRMLTYVILIEVGYMVGGLWLGNRSGITGAILHLLNDVFMTLCVFLAAANIQYRIGDSSFAHLKELFARMPFTMGALVAGALSIIGVPPTCGFFSKWYLLLGALQAGQHGFLLALIFSSLVSMVLFFRVFEGAFFAPAQHQDQLHGSPKLEEAPTQMVVPLLAVAAGLVALGLLSGEIVSRIVEPVIPRFVQ